MTDMAGAISGQLGNRGIQHVGSWHPQMAGSFRYFTSKVEIGERHFIYSRIH